MPKFVIFLHVAIHLPDSPVTIGSEVRFPGYPGAPTLPIIHTVSKEHYDAVVTGVSGDLV
jgi:hypothetical protein|tara:strand:- start:425 stop:604 length:180 start_codon:yes stop_codon:yes gene_type:complete